MTLRFLEAADRDGCWSPAFLLSHLIFLPNLLLVKWRDGGEGGGHLVPLGAPCTSLLVICALMDGRPLSQQADVPPGLLLVGVSFCGGGLSLAWGHPLEGSLRSLP